MAIQRYLLAAITLGGAFAAAKSQYDNDILIRCNIATATEMQAWNEWVRWNQLDEWARRHDPSTGTHQIDLRMEIDDWTSLDLDLPTSVSESCDFLIDAEKMQNAVQATYPPEQTLPDPTQRSEKDLFFANYQPLSAITPWMELLAALYSTHASLITIGESFEGRPITGLRIGLHANHDPPTHPRQTILIMGGLHAREWISTSTVTYIAYSLLHNHRRSPRITRLLKHFDFILLPTLNPDGYEYTWTEDRLWRKTRQDTTHQYCPGIDLDRAFNFEWRDLQNACSESYPGPEPFAAIEAAALAAWAKNVTESGAVRFAGLLDLHSYSETILYPYSYTCAEEPPSLENLEELASGLRRAVSDVHGHRYGLMRACEENLFSTSSNSSEDGDEEVEVLETPGGGSALDYFYHVMGVRYSYQIKLRDRGSYGFLLPPEHIVPTGKEILNAVLFMGDWLWEAGEGDTGGDGDEDDGGDGGDHDDDVLFAIPEREGIDYDAAEQHVFGVRYVDGEEVIVLDEEMWADLVWADLMEVAEIQFGEEMDDEESTFLREQQEDEAWQSAMEDFEIVDEVEDEEVVMVFDTEEAYREWVYDQEVPYDGYVYATQEVVGVDEKASLDPAVEESRPAQKNDLRRRRLAV